MTALTIQLTDQQADFLERFARTQYDGAEDNLATREPLHVVQTKKYTEASGRKEKVPYWENVAFFFIRGEAEKYVQYQSHNLNDPYISTQSPGYGNNGDFPCFRELLLQMGYELTTSNV
ncbi:hypothetical protein [Salibacterium aidingense]|uniref:hypothetical protein n=1 Tax=Salibacterium aidingense TaxID=384933 RepID=UPI0003F8F2E2|nr:hypothetical protein [Salibacterium aidingense]